MQQKKLLSLAVSIRTGTHSVVDDATGNVAVAQEDQRRRC